MKKNRSFTKKEISAIRDFRNGCSKQAAYRKHVLTSKDRMRLKDTAIKMKAQRFFERPEVAEAVRMTDDDFERLDCVEKVEEEKVEELKDAIEQLAPAKQKVSFLDAENVEEMTPEQLFFHSLKFSKERPDEIILTGTARFILQRAITEIQLRAKQIREEGKTALDRDASAFTTQNLNAIKIGVSILENRTERYLTAYQNNNTMALELLNRSIQAMNIDPEDYTAPIPGTADENNGGMNDK